MVIAEITVRQCSVTKGAARYKNFEKPSYMQIISLCHIRNCTYRDIFQWRNQSFLKISSLMKNKKAKTNS